MMISRMVTNAGITMSLYPHGRKVITMGLLNLLLLVNSTIINADVSLISNEKNAKVKTGKIAVEQPLAQSALPDQLLYAEQWELIRSGESILSLPALKQTVNRWLQDRKKKIQIQYPGGEEGELWVQELADWLVSLGIPSDHLLMVPGSGADDVIRFELVK